MNTQEFTKLMRTWHPELLPPGLGSMSIRQGIEALCKITGFPIPRPDESLEKIFDDLWVFI